MCVLFRYDRVGFDSRLMTSCVVNAFTTFDRTVCFVRRGIELVCVEPHVTADPFSSDCYRIIDVYSNI